MEFFGSIEAHLVQDRGNNLAIREIHLTAITFYIELTSILGIPLQRERRPLAGFINYFFHQISHCFKGAKVRKKAV